MEELRDIMKRQSLWIIDTDEEESQVNDIEHTFKAVTEKNSSQIKEKHTHTNTRSTQNTK